MRGRPGDADDPDVRLAIDEQDAASYRAAAEAINESGADAVWLQHEFGIFGGPAGGMILELVERIAAPLIITLHTVLEKPSADQRSEEHTSELQSLMRISYAVFCLKKKKKKTIYQSHKIEES